MNSVEEIANTAIDACLTLGVDYMLTGALAFNNYAVPRSTKDVDLVDRRHRSQGHPKHH